jgi:NAD(P)-dependent dehydrogenase (short-subunit alcohol dehydrogenase family)
MKDQVIIITGAAGTLGGAVARVFHEAGASLVLVDRREDRLPKAVPDFLDDPRVHFATGVDLTEADDVDGMTTGAFERFGRIDGLVNTAGGYRAGKPVHETELETWAFMYELNLRTALLTSRSVVPYLQRQPRGNIVNVSAYAALSGKPKMAAYTTAKSAVIRLTESMAEELRPDNINVNCLLPNVIDTPENREASPNADYSRWVKPEAIAEVALFLCSPSSRSIYGAAIPVRGPC